MIKSRKELKEYLDYEFKKYFSKTSKFKVWLFSELLLGEKNVIWKFQKNLRKLEYFINTNKKFRGLILKIKHTRLSIKLGLHIPPNSFEKGLKIMYLGSILVNGNARIGRDCSIHINTNIVAGGNTHDAPVLGDGVVISVGASIIGGVKIGDNCVIGAGAVVTKSFDNNVTVGGVPAKIISFNGSDSWRNINLSN